MGYVRGLIHGTIIGTAVGLCIAPQEGRRTRDQVQRATAAVRDGAQRAQETARRVAPTVQQAARTAGEAVGTIRGRVDAMRHEDSQSPFVSVNGGPGGLEH